MSIKDWRRVPLKPESAEVTYEQASTTLLTAASQIRLCVDYLLEHKGNVEDPDFDVYAVLQAYEIEFKQILAFIDKLKRSFVVAKPRSAAYEAEFKELPLAASRLEELSSIQDVIEIKEE